MAAKRTIDQDPEYDLPVEFREKRIKVVEDNARKQTQKKIKDILSSNFEEEKRKRHEEVDNIDELLHESRCILDRLRACAITKYYANLVQEQAPNEQASSSIHPTVKKYLSKSPRRFEYSSYDGSEGTNQDTSQTNENSSGKCEFQFNNKISSNETSDKATNINQSPSKNEEEVSTRAPRFKRKCKIVIGNISKFIPMSQRGGSDKSSHKWMVYVRGDKNNPNIESFVRKVKFLLHETYKPSDVVEIRNYPFHLIKRGWGEFPVRVQIFFRDPRNKPIDTIHNLKLDKTYTGLQTLGGETVIELQLFKSDVGKPSTVNGPFSSVSSPISSLASTEHNTTTTITCNGPVSSELGSAHIIKKQPDSLVMNIKLPKTVNNEAKSDQISVVNNLKLIVSQNDSTQSESNSNKKIVPKIMISNNRVITKSLTDKPVVTNGLNTTFVKCKDNEGRVLLVPQSSLKFKTPPSIAKQNNIPETNCVDSVSSNSENDVNKTVPSYILKVVPNQNSGQNQVFLIPLSDKKAKTSISKLLSENKSEPSVEQDVKKSEPAFNMASLVKKNPHLLYDFKIDSIKLDYYNSFEELLKRVCKIYPLIKSDVDRKVLPFCARSLEEFHTWNIGKQRAAEWRRAGMVRKAILKLLEKNSCSLLNLDSVWSRSSIMSWCRKNGFVPMATEKVTFLPEPKWSGVELCSLTNPDDLLSTLPEEKYTPALSDDEEVDIITIADEKPSVPHTTIQQEACYLPHLSDSSLFVKQTASQLGIDIKPVELEPNLHFPAIEEMLLSACQQMVSDLIGTSLQEGFKRLGGKICPEEITVSDVYSAVKNTPKFDLFSNSNLGLPKNPPGST